MFPLFQEILVDRAVHAAVGRYLLPDSVFKGNMKPTLVKDDFSQAMHDFLPVAMRGISKAAADGSRSGWDDIGGLNDIRNAIKEVYFSLLVFNLLKIILISTCTCYFSLCYFVNMLMESFDFALRIAPNMVIFYVFEKGDNDNNLYFFDNQHSFLRNSIICFVGGYPFIKGLFIYYVPPKTVFGQRWFK